jgi:hypothetical protein
MKKKKLKEIDFRSNCIALFSDGKVYIKPIKSHHDDNYIAIEHSFISFSFAEMKLIVKTFDPLMIFL